MSEYVIMSEEIVLALCCVLGLSGTHSDISKASVLDPNNVDAITSKSVLLYSH